MKKIISLLLIAGILAAMPLGMAYADEESSTAPIPYYLPESGTVVSVQELEAGSGTIYRIEGENGNLAVFYTSERTYFPFENDIAVGDDVTGYYLADAPVPAIWPPQYHAEVILCGMPEGLNIHIDRFFAWEDGSEGMLIGRGEIFAFRLGEDTEIITADGLEYDGEIEGRRLAVIYGASTRSIPEQATATKVIALFEDAVHLPGEQPAPIPGDMPVSRPGLVTIIYNGEPMIFEVPPQIINGRTMVPLRALFDNMGADSIDWNQDTQTATVVRGDITVVITIGDVSPTINGIVYPIDQPPVVISGRILAPIRFAAEAFGGEADWDPLTWTGYINLD